MEGRNIFIRLNLNLNLYVLIYLSLPFKQYYNRLIKQRLNKRFLNLDCSVNFNKFKTENNVYLVGTTRKRPIYRDAEDRAKCNPRP